MKKSIDIIVSIKILNVNDSNDTLSFLHNVITERDNIKNKNKNRRKSARQFLNVISITSKTNSTIKQIIINIYQLSNEIETLQKKHNLTINNLIRIKKQLENVITKKNVKDMITKNDVNLMTAKMNKLFEILSNKKSFKLKSSIQKNQKKSLSNSIFSRLFQSISQIYFDLYEFQNNQIYNFSKQVFVTKTIEKFQSFESNMHQQQVVSRVTFYESQNARNHSFNTREKFFLFANDFHQKRHSFSNIETHTYHENQHRDRIYNRHRNQSRIKSIAEFQILVKSIEFKSFNVDYFFSNMSNDQKLNDVVVKNKNT